MADPLFVHSVFLMVGGVNPGRRSVQAGAANKNVNTPPLATMYDISVRVSGRLFDRIALLFVAGLWLWKVVEYAGRLAGWLERNLGWGFYVDFTVPIVATVAFLLFVVLRRIARLPVR